MLITSSPKTFSVHAPKARAHTAAPSAVREDSAGVAPAGDNVTFSATSEADGKRSIGTKVLTGLGIAGGVVAAAVGGVAGAGGAAVGALVGAGVGAAVNLVRNFDIYSPKDLNLGEGAKAGAAVGATIGGVIGAAGGFGAVALTGGTGALIVGGGAIGVLSMFDNYYNK